MRRLAAGFLIALGLAPAADARPGDLDRRFGGDGEVRIPVGRYSEAYDVELDSRGRLIAAGECCGYDDQGVIRVTRAGRLDRRYGNRGRTRLRRTYRSIIEIDGRDRVYHVDEKYRNGAGAARVRRLTPNGRIDRGFGTTYFTASDVLDAALAPDGSLIVQAHSSTATVVARVTASGRVAWRLELPDAAPSLGIVVTADGTIVVLGQRSGQPAQLIHRVGLDGTLLTTTELPLHPDGVPLLAPARDGGVYLVNGDDRSLSTARMRPDGEMDAAFGAVTARGSRLPVPGAVALDRAGRIVVAGTDYSGREARFGIARLKATGALDRRFGRKGTRIVNAGRSTRSYATSMAVDPSGRTATIGGAASDERGEIREDYGTRHFAFARVHLR